MTINTQALLCGSMAYAFAIMAGDMLANQIYFMFILTLGLIFACMWGLNDAMKYEILRKNRGELNGI